MDRIGAALVAEKKSRESGDTTGGRDILSTCGSSLHHGGHSSVIQLPTTYISVHTNTVKANMDTALRPSQRMTDAEVMGRE